MDSSSETKLTLTEFRAGTTNSDRRELWAAVEHLTLEIQRNLWDASPDKIDVDFALFPLLYSLNVKLQSLTSTSAPLSLGLRSATITFLHLSNLVAKPSVLASILADERLPKLEELILEELDHSHEKDEGATMIYNKTVQRLVVIGKDSPLTLTQVTLNSLSFLRLAGVRYFDKKHRQSALEDFVQRSRLGLRILSLEDSKLNSPEIGKLVGKAPHIQQVYVQDCGFFHHIGSARRVPLSSVTTITCTAGMFPNGGQDGVLKVMMIYFRVRGTGYGAVAIETPAPRYTATGLKEYAQRAQNLATVGVNVREVASSPVTPAYPICAHSYDPSSFTRLSGWGEYSHDDDDDDYYDSDDYDNYGVGGGYYDSD